MTARRPPATSPFARVALLVAGVYGALLVAVWLGVSRWASYPASAAAPVLSTDEARAAVMRALRDTVDGRPPAPAPRAVSAPFHGIATLHCAGRPVATAPVSWTGAALDGPGFASDEAVRSLSPDARNGCRVKLDVLVGRAPIVSTVEALFVLSVIPGVDGIGVQFGDREVLVLPDELLREGLLTGYRPLPAIDFTTGLDVRAALRLLATRAGVDADGWRRAPHHLFRFRTEPLVESATPGAAPLPVFRGNPPAPPLRPDTLRAAALAGARYLALHLHPDGRFDYQYDTASDQPLPDDSDYSIPRHAGAAYYLAQAAGAFGDAALQGAAARALRYLVLHRPDGCDTQGPDGRACAARPDETVVNLGSSALALLAAVEYRQNTGDAQFDPWMHRLARFLVALQKDDGDFSTRFDLEKNERDEHTRMLYYPGEATLALARYATLLRALGAVDTANLPARLDRALEHLTVADYDFFAGRFFVGEDHWTCIAVDAAWDLLDPARRDRYADFCDGFAAFQDRTMFHAGDGPTREQPDLVGAYGFTPFIAPHATPVGSRGEALISVYRVAEKRGRTDAANPAAARTASIVRAAMRFLLAHQIRDDGAYLMARPEAARGGFLMSDPARFIRIDFVQHTCSAMLRAAAIPALSSDEPPAGATRPYPQNSTED